MTLRAGHNSAGSDSRAIIADEQKADEQKADEQKADVQNADMQKARQLTLLGILLQALHVLFGVTAILGVLITQTRINQTLGTVYYSHLQWQFVTFWIALIGYAIGFYFWAVHQFSWGVLAVLAVVIYRLLVSLLHWKTDKPMTRWF